MREWIQTGVMVVFAAVGVAAVSLLIMMMGRMGTANDAMESVMKQVATSNEAMMKAMVASNEATVQALAEQQASNEALLATLSSLPVGEGAPVALELSTIEIVVRRGSPEGPAAPEVKVEMRGKGQNSDSMTVQGVSDSDGRTSFERLYQGEYNFSFEDPVSALYARKSITLFAGKGDGEHIVVAPDVVPRPIHIDWGQPEYGRDEELLIGTSLESRWFHEEFQWSAVAGVLTGHRGTRVSGPAAARPMGPNNPNSVPDFDLRRLAPCELAGSIHVTNAISTWYRQEAEQRWDSEMVILDERARQRVGSSTRTSRSSIAAPVLEEISNGHFQGELPSENKEYYERSARRSRNLNRVPEGNYESWVNLATDHWPNAFVAAMQRTIPDVRIGEWREGYLYEPQGWNAEIHVGRLDAEAHQLQRALAFPMPEWKHERLGKQYKGYLALSRVRFKQLNRSQVDEIGPYSFLEADEASGNVLAAYAIYSDWREQTWPVWIPDAEDAGATVDVAEIPFWESSIETLGEHLSEGNLYIPVPQERLGDSSPSPSGVLLRWKESSEDQVWHLSIDLTPGGSRRPCWIVTETIDGAEKRGNKGPSDDHDGRFQYDKNLIIPPRKEPLSPQDGHHQSLIVRPSPKDPDSAKPEPKVAPPGELTN